MAPLLHLQGLTALVGQLAASDTTSMDEASMLQMPVVEKAVETDSSECRCPGYFQEQCDAAHQEGCGWREGWCQCINDPIPRPIAPITLAPQPEVKGPCEDYFGDMEGIVTVADPDVGHTGASSPYCESNGMSSPCIYMHLAGSANECQSPAPPDGCHRYHTVKYSECPELESFNFQARIDTAGAFDAEGVFIACADHVISNEVNCYGPPADLPESCDCSLAGPEPEVKGPCEDYFGDMEGIVTVADPDVGHTDASSPYCESNGMSSPCIYMHLAGSANECQSPAPPDGCHRYHTVKYSECPELGRFNFDARIDTTGAFDTEGVFIACADSVISNEVNCYGPPADLPESCDCSLASA